LISYLNLKDKDVVYKYPNKNIQEKVEKSSSKKQLEDNISKAESMGYRKIHFCGYSYERNHCNKEKGNSVKTHWRRGHWRHQLYGVGLSEHKLIWIRPAIVRKDQGEPTYGHIYQVDSDKN